MKTKIAKIILLVLAIALVLSLLTSCDKGSNIEVTIMDGETVLDTVTIKDGKVNIDELKAKSTLQKTGYEVVGFYTDTDLKTAFVAEDEVTASITIYVKYAANTYYISVNTDGGNKIDKIAVTKGGTYSVPTPTKAGFEFVKYTYLDDDAVAQDFAQTGTYTFNHNTAITAHWRVPNKYTLTVKDTNASGAVIDTKYYATGEAYELNANPEKYDHEFAGYQYNNAAFPATGTYTYEDDIVVYAIFTESEDATFIKNTTGYYFKERATTADPFTYVFLTGADYTFDGYELASTADETNIRINSAKNKFTAIAPGTFTFTAKKLSTNTVATINAKVVYDISSIAFGSAFNGMIANAKENANFQETVASKADYVMIAGKDNFIPEVSILNDSASSINLEQANIIVTSSNNDLTSTISGNVINFNSTVDGDVVTLTFTPKYSFDNNLTATLKVSLNTGVNVYDNATLKAAYSNNEVQSINVLRNIVAEFDASDYRTGFEKGLGSISLTKTNGDVEVINNVDVGNPINWYGGGVYRRTTQNAQDNLVINGNYFTIDGTKLPYINTISNIGDAVGYDVGDVQIGIFLYRNATVSGLQCNPATDKRERDSDNFDDIYVMSSDGKVTFNNLKIEGNSRPEHVGSTETDVTGINHNPLLKMSCSINGIVVRGGTVNLNNVSIFKTNIGLFMTGGVSGYYKPGLHYIINDVNVSGTDGQVQENETQAAKANLTSCIIDNSWADSLYNYDLVAISIANSRIGSSSGPAIHFDDRPYGGTNDGSLGFSNLNSSLKLDMYTASNINNWVAGTEPWFVAYNQTDNAALIKSQMETGANGNGMTILSQRAFSEVEFMNFAIVMRKTGSGAAWSGDNHTGIYLEQQAISNTVSAGPPQCDVVFFYGNTTEQATIGGNLSHGKIVESNPFLCAFTGAVNVYVRAYANA